MNENVTWATPLQRAERAMRDAEKELELGTRSAAYQSLSEAIGYLGQVLTWMQKNPPKAGDTCR